jgi:hypothetical protein
MEPRSSIAVSLSRRFQKSTITSQLPLASSVSAFAASSAQAVALRRHDEMSGSGTATLQWMKRRPISKQSPRKKR